MPFIGRRVCIDDDALIGGFAGEAGEWHPRAYELWNVGKKELQIGAFLSEDGAAGGAGNFNTRLQGCAQHVLRSAAQTVLNDL